MTTVVIVVLAVWLALSVASQLGGSIARALAAHDPLYLIPGRYSLFAPDPVVDYHLVFRDFDPDGTPVGWRESRFTSGRPRGLAGALWNPAHRSYAAVGQAVAAIVELGTRVGPDGIRLLPVSFPYLFLLYQVMRLPRTTPGASRQFMIVESVGFGAERRLALGILSELHA
jgi:hypothetical protein